MERGGCGESVVGTLLGPEGADLPGEPGGLLRVRALLFSYRLVPCGDAGVWRGCVGGVWSYVENCTVDASIFRLCSTGVLVGTRSSMSFRACGGWVFCVAKLLRAHGGCLGTRSR